MAERHRDSGTSGHDRELDRTGLKEGGLGDVDPLSAAQAYGEVLSFAAATGAWNLDGSLTRRRTEAA